MPWRLSTSSRSFARSSAPGPGRDEQADADAGAEDEQPPVADQPQRAVGDLRRAGAGLEPEADEPERQRQQEPDQRQQRLHELVGVELDEVAARLPEAHQLHRDAELVLDGEDDAALRRAVELREHDAGDVDGSR